MVPIGEKALLFGDPHALEPEALRQIQNTASLPFIFKHVAVMPDCHETTRTAIPSPTTRTTRAERRP